MMLFTALRTASKSLRNVRAFHVSTRRCDVRSLLAKFKDPHSPYHIPPGTSGPETPDGPALDIATHARLKLEGMGYEPRSFWAQQIVWGDHDSFQHVNNCRYVRFFESGRMQWIVALGEDIGGSEAAQNFLAGKGVGFILKSIDVKFRRPVTFPDTLLIGHKALPWPEAPADSTRPGPPLSKTQFYLRATAYSYAQDAIVADSTSVITWYDYEKLSKCDPGEERWAPLRARMQMAESVGARS
ncbi:unnamed protein product [Peniophora sp. CBMAI 1063]|nr:unnamed protein product [Peniophora sp. CBMAI 1063]